MTASTPTSAPLMLALAHGVEVLAVFAGFHGDLGEEDHVLGQLGELGHEVEALGADGCRALRRLAGLFCSRARRRSVRVTG